MKSKHFSLEKTYRLLLSEAQCTKYVTQSNISYTQCQLFLYYVLMLCTWLRVQTPSAYRHHRWCPLGSGSLEKGLKKGCAIGAQWIREPTGRPRSTDCVTGVMCPRLDKAPGDDRIS